MSNELTDVRCPCGDEYPADSYDAGFIAGSGMCQNCDAALPPKDICTCPSGDGSLRWPCPKHPAVEQAGGDERAVDGKPRATKCPDCGKGDLMPGDLCTCGYETDPAAGYACSECDGSGDGCVGEVCRECDGTGWFVTPEQARAALAQPSQAIAAAPTYQFQSREIGESDWAPCDFRWYLYCSKSPEMDTRVVEVAAQPSPVQAEAEVERPIVSFEKYMQVMYDRDENAKRLDAALAEVERLRQFERICEGLPQDAIDGGWTVQGIRAHSKQLEEQLKVALARVAELEKQDLVDVPGPDEIHQMAFEEGQPADDGDGYLFSAEEFDLFVQRLLDSCAAHVAQAQPEETPGEILAAKLIETWVTKHGKPAPWSTAVEITAVATNMPNDERDRLLALDDDVDAQAQHSVPETINEEANSFLRIADAGQFKDNAVAVRTAAVIIRGLLHRPPLMQSIIRHRIGLTPEYEGQWHADLYGEDGEVQHHAEADTPDEAVRAVVALAAAPGKEGL